MKVLALGVSLITSPVRADPTERAARLYDEGAGAYDRRDYDSALRALAAADTLSPDPITLELALKAANRSNLPVLALETADRALFRGGPFLPLARSVRSRFAMQVGTIEVHCARCVARLDDDTALTPGVPHYALPGSRRVVSVDLGREKAYEVEVNAGQLTLLRIEDAPRSVVLPQRATTIGVSSSTSSSTRELGSSGVGPAWFWVGAGLTAALSLATGVSALDTRARHEEFERSPSSSSARAGSSSQLRTNWLAAGSLASGLGTVALGFFVVRWGQAPPMQARSSE